MQNTVTVTQPTLDFGLLLLAHMACVDQQIHSEEIRKLNDFAGSIGASDATLEAMNGILAQDEDLIPVGDIIRAVPSGSRDTILRQVVAMAYEDGYFSPLERELLTQISGQWDLPADSIDRLCLEAEADYARSHQKDTTGHLTPAQRILRGTEKTVSRQMMDHIIGIMPKAIADSLQEARRSILLDGPDYQRAIDLCAAVAQEDSVFTDTALTETERILGSLGTDLSKIINRIEQSGSKGSSERRRQVCEFLKGVEEALRLQLVRDLQHLRHAHLAKQRAMSFYSIAFMGKTKAGKSTLHAVVTGEGWDGIGIGSQRTTRLNRVYEWKNIRIIDTPGIGAPGGKTDEEVAASVIDEADLVCYVLTNDSQQETEFQFLKTLKAKNKPVLLLLNVKQNLKDSARLKRFLNDPAKPFIIEGPSGLGGHIDRIRRYASQHYGNDYFEIIPVMLIAAQLAQDPVHAEHREILQAGSRVQQFLDAIRLSLVDDGAVRRSQTFLGCTVGDLQEIEAWLAAKHKEIAALRQSISESHHQALRAIEQAGADAHTTIDQKLKALYQQVRDIIPSFADDHWQSDESSLSDAWQDAQTDFGLDKRLNQILEEVGTDYGANVQDTLAEVGRELQLIAKLSTEAHTGGTEGDTSFAWGNAFKVGGILLGGAAMFFGGWIVVGLGALGALASWIGGLFESRDSKRRKAVAKITDALTKQIGKQEVQHRQAALKAFDEQHHEVLTHVQEYFGALEGGLSEILNAVNEGCDRIAGQAVHLNRAYAKRLLDWCSGQNDPLTPAAIDASIGTVERVIGHQMKVTVKHPVKLKKTPETIHRVLQEDVTFQAIQG